MTGSTVKSQNFKLGAPKGSLVGKYKAFGENKYKYKAFGENKPRNLSVQD